MRYRSGAKPIFFRYLFNGACDALRRPTVQRLLRFRDLEYFIAVAEHRSFAKAAEALGVAQPTVSNQIRKFEEALDCRAFRRDGRGVGLTPDGERLFERAQIVMAAFHDLERATRGERMFSGGRIRVGAIPTVSPYLAPPLLARVCARNEGGVVTYAEALTETLERRVARGELDFAVTATLPQTEDVVARRIVVERLVYLSADRFDDDPFGPETPDAARRPILLMHEGHCFRDAVYASIARVNDALADEIAYDFAPTSLATLVGLVRGGLGDAVAPAPFAAIAGGGVHAHALDPARFQRTLQLIVRSGREKHADMARVAELLRAAHMEASEEGRR